MGYADLACSHVKECLREGFGLSSLMVDEDGDVPFRHGSAKYWVTVRSDGQRVRVWAHAVRGVTIRAALLRELNEVNAGLELGRCYVSRDAVVIEGVLPVDGLTPVLMRELCLEVGSTSDTVGQLVAAVHGGQVTYPGGCDVCSE